ncbi:hypothetical protein HBI68_004380 [Parastagonospora nodorum]|nr:hypothetical protein HBI68_004380 [Parastagonospora nodorum]
MATTSPKPCRTTISESAVIAGRSLRRGTLHRIWITQLVSIMGSSGDNDVRSLHPKLCRPPLPRREVMQIRKVQTH